MLARHALAELRQEEKDMLACMAMLMPLAVLLGAVKAWACAWHRPVGELSGIEASSATKNASCGHGAAAGGSTEHIKNLL